MKILYLKIIQMKSNFNKIKITKYFEDMREFRNQIFFN